jgi:hypothetical protein
MQRAKFSMSCWAWAWLALVWPPELDELGELEPHAAITVAAAIAAAVRAVGGHARRGRRMTQVLSFIMPSSGLDDRVGRQRRRPACPAWFEVSDSGGLRGHP